MGSKWTSGHSCVQSQACQLLSTRTPGDSGGGFTNTMAPELCFCANFQLVFGKHSKLKKKKKSKQAFGTIKEHMTSTVTLCGWDCSLCQGMFGLEEGARDCVAACCRASYGALR